MVIATSILVVLALVNAVVTVLLWRSPQYLTGQRLVQLGLIWLIPVVGAAIVYYFIRDTGKSKAQTTEFVDDLAVSGDQIRVGNDASDFGVHGDGGAGH
jgi:hypothetical protein